MHSENNAATLTHEKIVKGAVIGGVINGIINGAVQYFMLSGETAIPLTVNSIINDEHTVLGAAVPLAVILAMILSVIAHLTLKVPKKPFMPQGLWLTIKHGLFIFGLIVSSAIVWQRIMGSMTVSFMSAVVILGVVAGIVAAVINYMTIKASILPQA